MLEIAIGAAVGGFGNYLSKSSAVKAQQRKIQAYQDSIRRMKLTNADISKQVDEIGDLYNTKMMDELNTTGVGLAIQGSLNPANIRAGIGSKMLGQRATAMLEYHQRMIDYNKSLDMKIADSEMERPDDAGIGDVLLGMPSGAMVGAEISKITSPPKVDIPDIKFGLSGNQKGFGWGFMGIGKNQNVQKHNYYIPQINFNR